MTAPRDPIEAPATALHRLIHAVATDQDIYESEPELREIVDEALAAARDEGRQEAVRWKDVARDLRGAVSNLPEAYGGFGLVRRTEVDDAIVTVLQRWVARHGRSSDPTEAEGLDPGDGSSWDRWDQEADERAGRSSDPEPAPLRRRVCVSCEGQHDEGKHEMTPFTLTDEHLPRSVWGGPAVGCTGCDFIGSSWDEHGAVPALQATGEPPSPHFHEEQATSGSWVRVACREDHEQSPLTATQGPCTTECCDMQNVRHIHEAAGATGEGKRHE